MKMGMVLALLVASTSLWAQASSKEDRTAILKYGIETEVLDLVQALRQEKNAEYRDLLLDAYGHARTDELKQALLLLFLDLKDTGLQDQAIHEISDSDKKGNGLLLEAVSYLTELKSQAAKESFATAVTGKNKILAVASIRALGKLGATDKVDDLLKIYQDAETDPNYKPDLIWTFGEMKAASAVDLLLKEYDENDAQPLFQRSILEALGKIGDEKAWDRIEAALAATNTDIRAAAVATLASFPSHPAAPLLASALRDAQPAVREAAALAAKTLKPAELKDILSYRVRKDPEAKVRVACLKALAAYGDGPSLVLSFVSDRKTEPATWRESLNLALDGQYPGTAEALRKLMEDDNKDKNGSLTATVTSALLSRRDGYRALFGVALASDKVPARAAALRAVSVGKYTEYRSTLETLAAKDADAGIRAQAAAILKDWGADPQAKKTN